MIVEFQVTASAFLAAQKATLESTAFCTPAIITVSPVQIVIDRIEFGVGSLRHNLPATYSIDYPYFSDVGTVEVDGFKTQIAQPITAHVTALNDLLQHPNGLPSVVVPISGTVVMDMQFYSGSAPDQNCYLYIGFADFELGPLPFLPTGFDPSHIPLPISFDDILAAIKAYLISAIPDRTVPIDVVSALPMKPGPSVLVNAGVSVDQQLQRLSFQVEIGPSGAFPYAPWFNFFKGFFNDRLQGAEWAIFMPGAYIASVIQLLIEQAVSDGLPDELSLTVSTSYSNATGHAVINNDILGIYHTPWPLPDLESNPQIPITVTLSSPNILTIDVGVPDIADLVKSFIPQWAKIFLRISGPIGGFLSALIDSAIAGIKVPGLPPECHRTAPANIRCTQFVSLPGMSDVVSPSITALLALDDGIALTGPLDVTSYTKGALDVTAHNFKLETPSFSCSSAGPEIVAAFANSPTSFDILHAQVFVNYSGTMPTFLCSVTPLLDAKNVFPVSSIRWDYPQAPLTIFVHPPVPPPVYYSAGAYPCVLLVKTTAGTRVISIPPPPALTQDDIERITADIIIKLGNCEQLYDRWWRLHSLVDPPWEINPRDRVETLHLWQVEVTGLELGGTVTLKDFSQREIATARERAGRVPLMTALVAPGANRDLSIVHGAPQRVASTENPTSSNTKHKLAITQRLLLRVGHVQLDQPCLQLLPAILMRRRAVLAVMGDRLIALDISGHRATLLASWSRQGIQGVVKLRDRFLMFGAEGLESLDVDANTVSRSSGCDAQDIRCAAAASGFMFGAGSHGLHVFTPQLCGTRIGDVDNPKGLVFVGGKLIAASATSLIVYDISEPRRPHAEHTVHFEAGISKISRPSGLDSGSFLLTAKDGSARLVAIEHGHIDELAVFSVSPWFDRAVRMGDVLVRMADRGAALEIYRLGPAVLV
jgi:hypothetical protein